MATYPGTCRACRPMPAPRVLLTFRFRILLRFFERGENLDGILPNKTVLIVQTSKVVASLRNERQVLLHDSKLLSPKRNPLTNNENDSLNSNPNSPGNYEIARATFS